jgi:hypothetical protein
MPASLRAGFVLALLLPLAACALNLSEKANGVGASVTRGVLAELRTDSARRTLRTIASDAVQSLSSEYGASLQPRLDTTVGKVLQSGHAFVSAERDSLLGVARGAGKAVVEDAVESSVRRAGDESRRQLRLAIGDATDVLRRDMIPLLAQSTRDAARDAAREASDAAFASVSPRLQVLVDSIVASAVRTGIRQGDHTLTTTAGWKTGIVIAGGFVGALLLLGLAWIWHDRNRTRSALSAVAAAVEHTTDPTLKTQIRERAERERVESYLHSFLARQGRL